MDVTYCRQIIQPLPRRQSANKFLFRSGRVIVRPDRLSRERTVILRKDCRMQHKLFNHLTSVILTLAVALASFIPVLAASPANDNFANAEVITALPFTTIVDITDAGVEPNEPQSCFGTDRTVWYSFTPSQTISVRITRGGSTSFSNLSVFSSTGPNISDLSLLWCPLYNVAPLTLEAGQTYYIQAAAYPGEVGTIQINMEQLFPPANDSFSSAEAITSLPFTTTVDISDAWNEPGETGNCSPMDKTVWYSFTPPQTMMVSLDTVGSTIFGRATAYVSTGSGISSLNLLGCVEGSFNFLAEAGNTYYLQIGASYDSLGTMQVNFRQIFPPANDEFINAQSIPSLPFNATIDNMADATTEAGEQQFCYFMDKTVWYSFTPTETMLVQADTQGSAVTGNMNIYHATGPGISNLQILTCTIIDTPTFLAEAGQTYYIQAGSIAGASGSIHINLQQIPPPANDAFENATLINSLPSTTSFDTSAATFQSSEPNPSCAYPAPPYHTVWFAFTATQDGSVSASIPSYGFGPFIAAYSGTNFNNLTQLGCNQYSNKVTIHVVSGQTYYFQVGGLNGDRGIGQFLLETTPPPQAGFYYYPGDPSRFDNVQFQDSSNDPGGLSLQTYTWDFGDGIVASGYSATHKYSADGNYQVVHTVTTTDGRTASITQTLQVRTHDVAITKLTTPNSANVGQTKTITVTLRNVAYPENVQVDLYKSTPNGFVFITTVTKSIPTLSGNRTTAVDFSYKFTSDDARLSKVTFKAVATIIGARDAYPSDNEAVSSITKVTK